MLRRWLSQSSALPIAELVLPIPSDNFSLQVLILLECSCKLHWNKDHLCCETNVTVFGIMPYKCDTISQSILLPCSSSGCSCCDIVCWVTCTLFAIADSSVDLLVYSACTAACTAEDVSDSLSQSVRLMVVNDSGSARVIAYASGHLMFSFWNPAAQEKATCLNQSAHFWKVR